MKFRLSQTAFTLGLLSAAILKIPWLALLLGASVGLSGLNFLGSRTHTIARVFLTCSVVMLGFCIPIKSTLSAGADGVVTTTVSVFLTITVALILGRMWKLAPVLSLLIGAGSAICGASAIIALSKVTKAEDEEVALSLATIFSLNAVALLLFPTLGHWLNLSQHDFGMWSGIAIHDTTSVAGAAAYYGDEALAIAVPVKLARAIWIIPLCILAGCFWKTGPSTKRFYEWIPPFIYLFFLASAFSSSIPWFATNQELTGVVVKRFLSVTLFLIGTGITLPALKKVGIKPLVLGLALWALISLSTLSALKLSLL